MAPPPSASAAGDSDCVAEATNYRISRTAVRETVRNCDSAPAAELEVPPPQRKMATTAEEDPAVEIGVSSTTTTLATTTSEGSSVDMEGLSTSTNATSTTSKEDRSVDIDDLPAPSTVPTNAVKADRSVESANLSGDTTLLPNTQERNGRVEIESLAAPLQVTAATPHEEAPVEMEDLSTATTMANAASEDDRALGTRSLPTGTTVSTNTAEGDRGADSESLCAPNTTAPMTPKESHAADIEDSPTTTIAAAMNAEEVRPADIENSSTPPAISMNSLEESNPTAKEVSPAATTIETTTGVDPPTNSQDNPAPTTVPTTAAAASDDPDPSSLNLREHLPPDPHFHDPNGPHWSPKLDDLIRTRTPQLTLQHLLQRGPTNPRISIYRKAISHDPGKRRVMLIKLLQSSTKETETTLLGIAKKLFYLPRARAPQGHVDNRMARLMAEGDRAVEGVAELMVLFREEVEAGGVVLRGWDRTSVLVLWQVALTACMNYGREREKMLERRYGARGRGGRELAVLWAGVVVLAAWGWVTVGLEWVAGWAVWVLVLGGWVREGERLVVVW